MIKDYKRIELPDCCAICGHHRAGCCYKFYKFYDLKPAITFATQRLNMYG